MGLRGTAGRVETGLDAFLAGEGRRYRRARLGLVASAASVDAGLRPAAHALRAAGFTLTALFGPEHGLWGAAAAGEPVAGGRDPATGVPVHSLYGATRSPTPEMLRAVDVLLVDLPDAGARFFTFASTMAGCLEAAAGKPGGPAGGGSGGSPLPVVVLDRPNPIGGTAVEGPLLDPGFASFVGRLPVPVRHGMTMGELALLFRAAAGLDCDLAVVPMRGWRRAMHWADTGLPFVPMTPNTTGPDMCLLYPGTCLVEGTNLSEGRGTARPFELIGAPWADGDAVAADLDRRALPGVRFRPARFVPWTSKHRGKTCSGVQVHLLDRRAARPVALGVHVLDAFRRAHPGAFRWRPPDAPGAAFPIDLLYGSDRLRRHLDAGLPAEDLVAAWAPDEAAFRQARRPQLLYP